MRVSRHICGLALIGIIVSSFLLPQSTVGQPSTQSSSQDEASQLISLNFPAGGVELRVLIDYVSQRTGVNILYDDQLVAAKVSLTTPTKVRKDALIPLLQSALRTKSLALAEADTPGWKRIVPVANLAGAAAAATQASDRSPAGGNGDIVTTVFAIENADVGRIDQSIKPFLTTPGGNSIAAAEARSLVVTDYAGNVQRVGELVKLLDRKRESSVEFIAVRNLDAQQLATQVSSILAARAKSSGTIGAGGSAAGGSDAVDVSADPRTNRLVVVGASNRVAEVLRLVATIDVPLDVQTRVYRFQSASAERVDRLARELIPAQDVKRLYQGAVDKEGNTLIVSATPAIHQRIAELQKSLDVPLPQEQSNVRFYKLLNTTASDVVQTIAAIEGSASIDDGANKGPARSGAALSNPATGVPASPGSGFAGEANSLTPQPSGAPAGGISPQTPLIASTTGNTNSEGAARSTQAQSVRTRDGTVTADVNTNSIIVVADPARQQSFEHLIKNLDKRRPQVLIECTIVTLDTSNSFSLGVDLGVNAGVGSTRFITLSSFGVGTANAANGQVALNPGTGFNGAVINSDFASAVVRALVTSRRARVVSAPRILVDDNAVGQLSSVSEQPFTSINAITGNTSTTSFAGYATAGTTISATPHISEGDHMQLDYVISLNSFTGASTAAGVPPPRQTDSVSSKVTMPDGDTIIVGGLSRQNISENVSAVPILGEIPLLKYLFSSRGSDDQRTTLFVFLRPVILRDDAFADLRYYSGRDVKAAGIRGDFPKSEPIVIR